MSLKRAPSANETILFKFGKEAIETMIKQNIVGKATNCSTRIYKEPKGANTVWLTSVWAVIFNKYPTIHPKTRAIIFTSFDLFLELIFGIKSSNLITKDFKEHFVIFFLTQTKS